MTVYLIDEPGTYWTLLESPEWKPLANVGSTTQSYRARRRQCSLSGRVAHRGSSNGVGST